MSEESQVFVVESLQRVCIIDGKRHYFVKWVGYDDAERTWEPLAHLSAIQKEVLSFDMTYRGEIPIYKTDQLTGDLVKVDDYVSAETHEEISHAHTISLSNKLIDGVEHLTSICVRGNNYSRSPDLNPRGSKKVKFQRKIQREIDRSSKVISPLQMQRKQSFNGAKSPVQQKRESSVNSGGSCSKQEKREKIKRRAFERRHSDDESVSAESEREKQPTKRVKMSRQEPPKTPITSEYQAMKAWVPLKFEKYKQSRSQSHPSKEHHQHQHKSSLTNPKNNHEQTDNSKVKKSSKIKQSLTKVKEFQQHVVKAQAPFTTLSTQISKIGSPKIEFFKAQGQEKSAEKEEMLEAVSSQAVLLKQPNQLEPLQRQSQLRLERVISIEVQPPKRKEYIPLGEMTFLPRQAATGSELQILKNLRSYVELQCLRKSGKPFPVVLEIKEFFVLSNHKLFKVQMRLQEGEMQERFLTHQSLTQFYPKALLKYYESNLIS